MTPQTIILLFTLAIYILILLVFNKARKKYSGGKIGDVINLVIITVGFLLVADYSLLLTPLFPEQTLAIYQALFRTIALSVLAYGGVRVAS